MKGMKYATFGLILLTLYLTILNHALLALEFARSCLQASYGDSQKLSASWLWEVASSCLQASFWNSHSCLAGSGDSQ